MIRSGKMQTALFGGVGFKNPTLAEYAIVDQANQATASGLYFGDASELVTIKNIKDCQEDATISDADFNLLLSSMQKSVITDVCNKVISGQSDFIYSLNLYPYHKSFKNVLEPNSNFVGFEIEPAIGNTVCNIPWVELCFDTAKTFNIYLYNSNKPNTPLFTKSVTTVEGEAVIVALGWLIADDTTYKGGKFYLGYFEDDLDGAKAYKKDYDDSIFAVNTPYYIVEPVYLTHSGTMIDITSELTSVDTFGLNIGMDVYTDFTELLIRNKNLLFPAIQLQMHEKVLSMIKFSTRSNPEQRVATSLIDLELFGNAKMAIDGVTTKLNRSVSQLQKALFYVPRIQRTTARL